MLPSTTDDPIFDNLPSEDLVRYARVSKDTNYAVSSYLRRRSALEQVLFPYFTPDEVQKFRRLQHLTGTVISGSTALQFFDRSFYSESDLDLYVEYSFRGQVISWLKSIGYIFTPPPKKYPEQRVELDYILRNMYPFYQKGPREQTRFVDAGVGHYPDGVGGFRVLNFERGYSGRKIQVIVILESLVQSILKYHSTCVMNFITHDKAYSLYPRGTFKDRCSLIANTTDPEDVSLQKYARRGWTIVQRTTEDMLSDPHSAFAPGLRRVGDSKCWTLPIYPKLDLPESHFEANTWTLRHYGRQEPEIKFRLLIAWNLRFAYTVADRSLEEYLSYPFHDDDYDSDDEIANDIGLDGYLEETVKHYIEAHGL